MKNLKKEALQFMECLQSLYFEQRNLNALLPMMAENTSWTHLHLSAPDADQEESNGQLEALIENIPGGVYQCKCDSGMTFLSMSNSFLTLVRYTQQEIYQRFHNCFAEMIYQDDLKRIQSEMAEQLSRSDELELEYRILRGDGTLLWILEQGKRTTLANGSQCFYCVLMDITCQKEQREELLLMLERHQIIMNQTTDIMFEWDMIKDVLTFSSNWYKKFGYEAIRDSVSQKIPLSENIHPEDMPDFVKIMMNSEMGDSYSETELRIRDVRGNFRWYRIRVTIQYDSQRCKVKAVGVILDIDSDKKQKELLLEQAQRDSLTGLYNKAAIRDLATQRINGNNGNGNEALLIIDVDNFKGVNDTYGHLCGDSLLSDVAGVLKCHTRSGDLVGRIGGDEFLMYLPEILEKREVSQKVQDLIAALRKLSPFKDAPSISCSIGVAFFPQKSVDYFTLYKSADLALYRVKAQGKNNFAFYNPEDNENADCGNLSVSAVGGIDSELEVNGDAVGDKLAQYTFRMLYNSIDVNTAVEHLLEILGRAYDVSRVYIFESTEDGKKCNNTFEWCNTGVPSEIGKLQNIDYEQDLGGYFQNFDENHLFYCQDITKLHPDLYGILAPQGIYSILQCAIIDDGVFKGYVGFDECRENRSWTKPQIASLTLISNVLSTFLLKLRLKERAARDQKTGAGNRNSVRGGTTGKGERK